MEPSRNDPWSRRRGGSSGGICEPRRAAEQRWPRRRCRARLVVLLAYAVPVGAAVTASAVLARTLPAPVGDGEVAGEWILLILVSAVVLVAVDRVSRRLLPLAALLELSLAFPDQAPRRLAVAWRAGSIRNLHTRIEEAKRDGVSSEPARAAEAILELVGALHAHDRRTRGHSERVRALTDLLADELHLGPGDRDRLRWSALLHDVGKIHVPGRILNKPGRPTAHEWDAIRRHPDDGARLAAPLAPWLGEWAEVIGQHHERWDGSGYPRGLRGQEISYGARIVGLVDAFEVMTAARTYKKAMSVTAARRELIRCAGVQFDPALVRLFLGISIGRLRWIAGPLSWLAQVPFAGWVPHVAEGAAVSGSQAAGVVGVAASAAAMVVGTVALPGPGSAAAASTRTARPAPGPASGHAAPATTTPPAAPLVVVTAAVRPAVGVGSSGGGNGTSTSGGSLAHTDRSGSDARSQPSGSHSSGSHASGSRSPGSHSPGSSTAQAAPAVAAASSRATPGGTGGRWGRGSLAPGQPAHATLLAHLLNAGRSLAQGWGQGTSAGPQQAGR